MYMRFRMQIESVMKEVTFWAEPRALKSRESPRGAGGAGAAAGGSVHSGGEVLRPKANTKHNKESKDKIVSLVGWFFL